MGAPGRKREWRGLSRFYLYTATSGTTQLHLFVVGVVAMQAPSED